MLIHGDFHFKQVMTDTDAQNVLKGNIEDACIFDTAYAWRAAAVVAQWL